MPDEDRDKKSERTGRMNNVNRRKFVKAVGMTGAVATAGLSTTGIASAASTEYGEYTASDVRKVVSNHKELLTVLSEEGFIESSSVESLSIDTLSPPSSDDPDNQDGERVVRTKEDGEKHTDVEIIRLTERGALAIVASADDDHAYATLNPHEEDKPLMIIRPDGSIEEAPNESEDSQSGAVTTQGYPLRSICRRNCGGDCCNCNRVCTSGCNCTCTPSYTFRCNCCQLYPVKCASNCV